MNIDYFDNIRNDVIDFIPEGSYERILEVGGGEFSSLIEIGKRFSAETWGIDMYQNNKANIDCFIKGSIEDLETEIQVPDSSFDIFMANDVLEHLVHTDNFINVANKKLKNGGLLVMSVTNVRSIRMIYYLLIKGSFPRHDAGLFDRTHLRWFCKKDVIELCEENFKLLRHKTTGRFVSKMISKNFFGELLGLQNIFIFQKRIQK